MMTDLERAQAIANEFHDGRFTRKSKCAFLKDSCAVLITAFAVVRQEERERCAALAGKVGNLDPSDTAYKCICRDIAVMILEASP